MSLYRLTMVAFSRLNSLYLRGSPRGSAHRTVKTLDFRALHGQKAARLAQRTVKPPRPDMARGEAFGGETEGPRAALASARRRSRSTAP